MLELSDRHAARTGLTGTRPERYFLILSVSILLPSSDQPRASR